MSDFENDPVREARQVRLDGNAEGAQVVGYEDPTGKDRSWPGNEDAPYVAVLGRASSTGTISPTVQNGETQEVLLDEYGRVWTRILGTVTVTISGTVTITGEVTVLEPVPERVTTEGTALLQTTAIPVPANQRMRLRWAGVSLAGGAGAGRVLMVFDTNAVVANGAVPAWRAPILDAGTGYFNAVDVEWNNGALDLKTGFVLAISTTLDTLTLPGAAEGFFQALYTLEPL